MKPGDVLEVEITGIGTLRTRIVDERVEAASRPQPALRPRRLSRGMPSGQYGRNRMKARPIGRRQGGMQW